MKTVTMRVDDSIYNMINLQQMDREEIFQTL